MILIFFLKVESLMKPELRDWLIWLAMELRRHCPGLGLRRSTASPDFYVDARIQTQVLMLLHSEPFPIRPSSQPCSVPVLLQA